MSTKNKKQKTEATATATAVAVTPETTPVTETKKLGRPVDPNSPRQKMLAEKAALREAGLLKRGRKADPNSKNAVKQAIREAKIAAGIEIKSGRPKMEKVVTEAEVPATEG